MDRGFEEFGNSGWLVDELLIQLVSEALASCQTMERMRQELARAAANLTAIVSP
jgi:hypothetical protein